MGVIPCQSGKVMIGQHEVQRLRTDERVRRGIAYVPQVRDVFAPMSVLENLEMGGYLLSPKERDKRIGEVFELFPVLAGAGPSGLTR